CNSPRDCRRSKVHSVVDFGAREHSRKALMVMDFALARPMRNVWTFGAYLIAAQGSPSTHFQL
ncbi:unnamed protein product, partial [Nesidiocoris tenuis]